MNIYETVVTVQDRGEVRVAGVPFKPGTEVAVTICEKAAGDTDAKSENLGKEGVRMRDLFARVQAHNSEPVGPLRREELYDREILR